MTFKYKTYLFFLIFGLLSGVSFARDLPQPKLMLANIYHQGINLGEYWVSEKYDGVRALWNGEHLISRGGNIFHAPSWFIENFPKQKLDGELWIDRQKFESVVSTVRDKTPDDTAWKKIKYMVFDAPESPLAFDERLKQLRHSFAQSKVPWLRLVKQWKVKNHQELMRQLSDITKDGAEGLMLHRGSSLYKGKRSGDLLKVKPYQDAEAIVIGHIAGKGKYLNYLGALLVEMPSGIRFKLGTGLSDEERKNPPEVGETITYRYHGFTKNGIPRFASYLRIREVEDKKFFTN